MVQTNMLANRTESHFRTCICNHLLTLGDPENPNFKGTSATSQARMTSFLHWSGVNTTLVAAHHVARGERPSRLDGARIDPFHARMPLKGAMDRSQPTEATNPIQALATQTRGTGAATGCRHKHLSISHLRKNQPVSNGRTPTSVADRSMADRRISRSNPVNQGLSRATDRHCHRRSPVLRPEDSL